jgi:hypothetical protein
VLLHPQDVEAMLPITHWFELMKGEEWDRLWREFMVVRHFCKCKAKTWKDMFKSGAAKGLKPQSLFETTVILNEVASLVEAMYADVSTLRGTSVGWYI